jgi:outer membrane protein OmpA-like peptidoglycan-associated protein
MIILNIYIYNKNIIQMMRAWRPHLPVNNFSQSGNMRIPISVLTAVILSVFSHAFGVTYTSPIVNRGGQAGLFYSMSARTLGMGRININAYGNGSVDSRYIESITRDGVILRDRDDNDHIDYFTPVYGTINTDLALSYGITRFLDFSVFLPVNFDFIANENYWHQIDSVTIDDTSNIGGLSGGFGDLEMSLKFQYPPYPHRRFFEMAYFGAISIPTGNKNQGYFVRHSNFLKDTTITPGSGASYDSTMVTSAFSSRSIEIDMKMLWTFDLAQLRLASPVQTHVNFGVRWNVSGLDNLFLLNLAFEYHPVEWFGMFTEFSGETRLSNVTNGFKIGDDPLRLSPGISITPPGGFHFTLGVDINLSSDTALMSYQLDNNSIQGYRFNTRMEPRWRLCGTIGWAGYVIPQDADQDGIRDAQDRCPNDPEDLDGFEDEDGCPDNDNDRDGVTDLKDKCPNSAEDLDGFEDEDGCPDYDNDKDLVSDTIDQCPQVPEDIDGFEDKDGCPEVDNDGDGIPDTSDHCPMMPEDKDNFQDNDGCPDTDNDMDYVPDSIDRCPDVPGDADNGGCPKEKVKAKAKEIQRGRVILRGVNFMFGSAVLAGDSYAILDRVYESLVEWPEIKIEIAGHTDSVGNGIANKLLSRKRAESVRDYLISRGILPERLIAEGRGEDEPIADNATAEGRAMNRRVEMHRID